MTLPHTVPGGATVAAPLRPPARLLSTQAAAAYVGCRSVQTFLAEVAAGVWPPPLPLGRLSGKRKRQVWDLRALDARIAELAGHAPAPGDDIDLDWEMGLGDD